MLKFSKYRSKVMVKVTMSKIKVPMERSCHKEYTINKYESHMSYSSKVMSNVKVLKLS